MARDALEIATFLNFWVRMLRPMKISKRNLRKESTRTKKLSVIWINHFICVVTSLTCGASKIGYNFQGLIWPLRNFATFPIFNPRMVWDSMFIHKFSLICMGFPSNTITVWILIILIFSWNKISREARYPNFLNSSFG